MPAASTLFPKLCIQFMNMSILPKEFEFAKLTDFIEPSFNKFVSSKNN